MTRIDRILALDPDDVDSADVYFLMRIAREACAVGEGEPTNDLDLILEEEDEVEDELFAASGGPYRERHVEQHDLPDGRDYPEPSDSQRALGAAWEASGGDVMAEPLRSMLDAEPDPEVEYELEIIDQGFEPGTYAGWTVQFRAIGAPRLSYQQQDPILDAYVPLERAPETAPRLGAGGSTALARTSDGPDIENAMMGHDGGVLRGFSGAALLEVMPVAIGNAPVAIPSDERIAEACQKALRAHIAAVKAERARLAVTETTEASVVGKRLKVKG